MKNFNIIGKIDGLSDFPLSYDKIGYILPIDYGDHFNEYWGQQWLGKPHFYGIYIDNVDQQTTFGIWDKGILKYVLSDELAEVMSKTNRFQPSTFYKKYAFAGDICSMAALTENPNASTSRYGIAFCEDGIYFGEFPAGYKMKKCIGKHYDGLFNIYEGTFDLPIDEDVPWCDNDGDAFPF